MTLLTSKTSMQVGASCPFLVRYGLLRAVCISKAFPAIRAPEGSNPALGSEMTSQRSNLVGFGQAPDSLPKPQIPQGGPIASVQAFLSTGLGALMPLSSRASLCFLPLAAGLQGAQQGFLLARRAVQHPLACIPHLPSCSLSNACLHLWVSADTSVVQGRHTCTHAVVGHLGVKAPPSHGAFGTS